MNKQQQQCAARALYAVADAITAIEDVLDAQDDPEQGVDTLLRDDTTRALLVHLSALQTTHKCLTTLGDHGRSMPFGVHVRRVRRCVMAGYYE